MSEAGCDPMENGYDPRAVEAMYRDRLAAAEARALAAEARAERAEAALGKIVDIAQDAGLDLRQSFLAMRRCAEDALTPGTGE